MSFPTRDSQLVPYSTNWNTRLTLGYAAFGITEDQSAAYSAVHTPYVNAVTALANARASLVRSEPLREARDTARANLLAVGRELYAFVQANSAVSNENKALLGVVIRDNEPTPVPVPTTAPVMNIMGVNGRVVVLSVRGSEAAKRRPIGTVCAQIFFFAGDDAPINLDDWKFLVNAGRAATSATLPTDVAAGAKVWITGAWMNSRKEMGPMADPIPTHLGGGVSMAV